MANECAPGECENDPKYTTPVKLKPYPGGSEGGHEFVTELPETGTAGVEYVLMDDLSDCETYKGTYVYNDECGGWIPTSGSGGGSIERYTFSATANGWQALKNGKVVFTYVDKDTIDTYENTASGFRVLRNGSVIFSHNDPVTYEYTAEETDTGWVLKKDGTTIFTYTDKYDPSDGTYFVSGELTEVIGGTTTVAATAVTGLVLADVVIGETLIYDKAGTVGRVTAVTGTNLTVETITTSPGERRGTRLGAVDDQPDLPATVTAAVAMGWQTPLAGDFAYIREDSTHDDRLTEWVIQGIDGSGNITWAYSHTLNAGNYVLDIYKYGDYPSGSPIPKNADGSVTLPKDQDTTYDFENTTNGWQVKNHETGAVVFSYTDKDTDTTYDWEDTADGWQVKNHETGAVVYKYTEKGEKNVLEKVKLSDGTVLAIDPSDKSVTLPDDQDTTYDYEDVYDPDDTTKVIGWRVKNHDTGVVIFTHTDTGSGGDGTTYTFRNTAQGWSATNDKTGTTFIHADRASTIVDGKTLRATGASWFVDSDNGDDNTGDGTIDHPFRTIQKAIDKLPVSWQVWTDYDGYVLTDGIYINTKATNVYEPAYFRHNACFIRSYDASQSSSTKVYDDSATATLKIQAKKYAHPSWPEECEIHPSCWSQLYSYVDCDICNLNFTQVDSYATCMYVAEYSRFAIGRDYWRDTKKIATTITINCPIFGTQKLYERNTTDGTREVRTITNAGCEGLGVHNRSYFYMRGNGTNNPNTKLTINASNWGLAVSGQSYVILQWNVDVSGGRNTNNTSCGACYCNQNSSLILDSAGASTSVISTKRFTGYGSTANTLTAGDGGMIRTSSLYNSIYVMSTTTNTNVSATVGVFNNSWVHLRAYQYMHIENKRVTGRAICVGNGGKAEICYGGGSAGTFNIYASTAGSASGEAILGYEASHISIVGGSGTARPVVHGRVGYSASNGAIISYAAIGAWSGTTQRAASNGGRIYTGGQSSMGNY